MQCSILIYLKRECDWKKSLECVHIVTSYTDKIKMSVVRIACGWRTLMLNQEKSTHLQKFLTLVLSSFLKSITFILSNSRFPCHMTFPLTFHQATHHVLDAFILVWFLKVSFKTLGKRITADNFGLNQRTTLMFWVEDCMCSIQIIFGS